MPILSYDYYTSHNHSAVTAAAFAAAELHAESVLRSVIGPIAFGEASQIAAADLRYGSVMDCLCYIVDYFATDGLKLGHGVSSVSNDGYSETYGGLASGAEAKDDLNRTVRAWLSCTGLVRAY